MIFCRDKNDCINNFSNFIIIAVLSPWQFLTLSWNRTINTRPYNLFEKLMTYFIFCFFGTRWKFLVFWKFSLNKRAHLYIIFALMYSYFVNHLHKHSCWKKLVWVVCFSCTTVKQLNIFRTKYANSSLLLSFQNKFWFLKVKLMELCFFLKMRSCQ